MDQFWLELRGLLLTELLASLVMSRSGPFGAGAPLLHSLVESSVMLSGDPTPFTFLAIMLSPS